ncbi:unnamed protein product [Lactuca virosa]|uniref:Uncharacterized protein n=1 Tax=Lactuca virosa TaxID=75947 RepID=A0AAU9MKU8_9ASTR|nr:unnamed protein product [Lactuca virosa]
MEKNGTSDLQVPKVVMLSNDLKIISNSMLDDKSDGHITDVENTTEQQKGEQQKGVQVDDDETAVTNGVFTSTYMHKRKDKDINFEVEMKVNDLGLLSENQGGMNGIGSIAKCYTIFPRSRKREKSRVDHGLLIVNDLLLKMVELWVIIWEFVS